MDINCGMELHFAETSNLEDPDFVSQNTSITDKLDLGTNTDDVQHLLVLDQVSPPSQSCHHDNSDKHLTAADFKLDLGPASDLVSATDFPMENSVADMSSENCTEENSEGYSIVNAALEGHPDPKHLTMSQANISTVPSLPLASLLPNLQPIQVIPIGNLQNLQLITSSRGNMASATAPSTTQVLSTGGPKLMNFTPGSASGDQSKEVNNILCPNLDSQKALSMNSQTLKLGNVMSFQNVDSAQKVSVNGQINAQPVSSAVVLGNVLLLQPINGQLQSNLPSAKLPMPSISGQVPFVGNLNIAVNSQNMTIPSTTVLDTNTAARLKNFNFKTSPVNPVITSLASACSTTVFSSVQKVSARNATLGTNLLSSGSQESSVMTKPTGEVLPSVNIQNKNCQLDRPENNRKGTKILINGKTISMTFDCRDPKVLSGTTSGVMMGANSVKIVPSNSTTITTPGPTNTDIMQRAVGSINTRLNTTNYSVTGTSSSVMGCSNLGTSSSVVEGTNIGTSCSSHAVRTVDSETSQSFLNKVMYPAFLSGDTHSKVQQTPEAKQTLSVSGAQSLCMVKSNGDQNGGQVKYVSLLGTQQNRDTKTKPSDLNSTEVLDAGKIKTDPKVNDNDTNQEERGKTNSLTGADNSSKLVISPLLISNSKNEYKCDLCSASFNRYGNYTRHRMIHTVNTKDDYRYKCQECGRLFLQRCDMKRHMLIHSNEEPFRCEICGKGYIRRSDLVVHLRFHNKEKNFRCLGCNKQFYQSGDLNRHVRNIHLQSALLTCGHCSRQFAKEATLIRHMQTRHKDIIIKTLKNKDQEQDRTESSPGDIKSTSTKNSNVDGGGKGDIAKTFTECQTNSAAEANSNNLNSESENSSSFKQETTGLIQFKPGTMEDMTVENKELKSDELMMVDCDELSIDSSVMETSVCVMETTDNTELTVDAIKI